jgi:hypothetical protein
VNDQHLTGHHRTTLRKIFSHPLAQNLEWAEVTSFIGQVGSAVERHDGEFVFDVGSERAFFRRPHGKDLEGPDVARLRKFLEAAGVTAEGVPEPGAPAKSDANSQTLVIAVDHHTARIFALADGGKEMSEVAHLAPEDPHGFRRHLEHKKEADYQGERIPEDPVFYDRIADALKGAHSILLIGDSSGKSSAVTYLSAHLEKAHTEIFRRVAGTIDADLSALTDGEIKTRSAAFFASKR